MQFKLYIIVALLLLSCNKNGNHHNKFENIDVYNEMQINNFIQFFFKNKNDKNHFSIMLFSWYGSATLKLHLKHHDEMTKENP